MIDVIYKCRCMNREVGVYVRDREPFEEIDSYISGPIRQAISDDHYKRAPRCEALITEYVGLPFDVNDPAARAGSPIVRH